MPLMGLLVDLTQLKKESLGLRMSQQKPPELKSKEKKDTNKQTNSELKIQELWDNYKKCNTYIMGITEKKERNRRNI